MLLLVDEAIDISGAIIFALAELSATFLSKFFVDFAASLPELSMKFPNPPSSIVLSKTNLALVVLHLPQSDTNF